MQFLMPSKFREASFANRQWCCTPEAGVSIEEILKPEYWAHVSAKMITGDTIRAIPEDMAFFLELLVIDTSKQWAKVKEIHRVLLTAEEASPIEEDIDFEVKFRGARRWSVVRKSNNAVEAENMASKADAFAWISEYAKKMAA